MATEAFFLPVRYGQRFCLFHPAQLEAGTTLRGQLLYVHSFAEEMNKSRRMAALQSRALAQVGFDVLQIDLLGCGDSSGDFGDATWADWVNDVVAGYHWLRARQVVVREQALRVPLWLWGQRAGCLVVAQAARTLSEPCNFLFWAPTPSGRPLLQQFLRVKAAADIASGNPKAVMEGLRRDLAQGRPVEIAGYLLAPELANGLEQANLTPPSATTKAADDSTAGDVQRLSTNRVEWFELSTRDDFTLTPVANNAIEQWRQAGFTLRSHIVQGPAFWQTSEIEDAPALIAATTAALLRQNDSS